MSDDKQIVHCNWDTKGLKPLSFAKGWSTCHTSERPWLYFAQSRFLFEFSFPTFAFRKPCNCLCGELFVGVSIMSNPGRRQQRVGIPDIPAPSKRKRALVEHVKETLKRSCLAKIKARYRSTTRRRKKKEHSPVELQAQKDNLQATVAQEIDNCRRDLDRVRQDIGYVSELGQSAGPARRASVPSSQEVLIPDASGPAVQLFRSPHTGLEQHDHNISPASSDDDEPRPPPLEWGEHDQIDEESYIEIMQFVEENILKEVEREERELVSVCFPHLSVLVTLDVSVSLALSPVGCYRVHSCRAAR